MLHIHTYKKIQKEREERERKRGRIHLKMFIEII